MDHYGIRDTAKTLFTSFLTKRDQYVSINNVSTTKPINCGVPQGSVFGPLPRFMLTLSVNLLLVILDQGWATPGMRSELGTRARPRK